MFGIVSFRIVQEREWLFLHFYAEPETPAEQTTTGKQIGKWLNKNAEGMLVNVSASVYYEALKALFGL